MTTTGQRATEAAFSEVVRTSTEEVHRRAERARFVGDLLGGRVDRHGYARLLAQHLAVYSVLETVAGAMRSDPVAGSFADPALDRVPAIEADLEHFLGPRWAEEVEVLPATAAYCDRLREVGEWPAGFVAHHYVRYLGDLSGGRIIRRQLARAYGLDGADGLRFYDFDGLADPEGFKAGYRRLLDAAPWDDAERDRVLVEVHRAYELVTAVFEELQP
jgi:heme oxygenase